jgi:hypothetical protein
MGYRRLEEEEVDDLVLRVLREAGRPLTTREVQAEAEKDKIYPPHTHALCAQISVLSPFPILS